MVPTADDRPSRPFSHSDTLARMHPGLCAYYDSLQRVLCGSVSSLERLRTVVDFNPVRNEVHLADFGDPSRRREESMMDSRP